MLWVVHVTLSNTALHIGHLQTLTRAWGTSPMTLRSAHRLSVSSCRLWHPQITPWLGVGNSNQGSPLPTGLPPKGIATSTLDKWAHDLGMGESLTWADPPIKCPGCCQSRMTMSTTAISMPHSEMPWAGGRGGGERPFQVPWSVGRNEERGWAGLGHWRAEEQAIRNLSREGGRGWNRSCCEAPGPQHALHYAVSLHV